ncbi:MAG: hypothetical protein ACOC23_08795 [Thermodesulfobacteriota bacterium]
MFAKAGYEIGRGGDAANLEKFAGEIITRLVLDQGVTETERAAFFQSLGAGKVARKNEGWYSACTFERWFKVFLRESAPTAATAEA